VDDIVALAEDRLVHLGGQGVCEAVSDIQVRGMPGATTVNAKGRVRPICLRRRDGRDVDRDFRDVLVDGLKQRLAAFAERDNAGFDQTAGRHAYEFGFAHGGKPVSSYMSSSMSVVVRKVART
jgi:hypothetical protein